MGKVAVATMLLLRMLLPNVIYLRKMPAQRLRIRTFLWLRVGRKEEVLRETREQWDDQPKKKTV